MEPGNSPAHGAAVRIDEFASAGRCEFIGDLAGPFVADVLATVIFNEDIEDLFRETGKVNHELATKPNDAAFHRFAKLISGFIDRRVAARVQRPQCHSMGRHRPPHGLPHC
jgi:hypothetical protein